MLAPKLKKESRKSLKRKINKNRNTNFEYIERSEIDYNMFKGIIYYLYLYAYYFILIINYIKIRQKWIWNAYIYSR